MTVLTRHNDAESLLEVLRQGALACVRRRAAILHLDRLPQTLSRPHHIRLARQAMSSLSNADRAQTFELSRGRVAILWRSNDGPELAEAQTALDHLLAGQPADRTAELGSLLTLYDLPEQSLWLIDQLAERGDPSARSASCHPPMDLALLGQLEAGLAQADLSRFARWRPVMALNQADRVGREVIRPPEMAWEERYFALHELAENLCPQRWIKGDPWLFSRLTRMLDSRMLSLLAGARERRRNPFALHLNTATVLSPEFLRFDADLSAASRGTVTLVLRAADILADAATFSFARNFAVERQYRLALAGASAGLLRFFDMRRANIDVALLPLTPQLRQDPAALHQIAGDTLKLVLTGIDKPSDLRWAIDNGFRLGRGKALTQ